MFYTIIAVSDDDNDILRQRHGVTTTAGHTHVDGLSDVNRCFFLSFLVGLTNFLNFFLLSGTPLNTNDTTRTDESTNTHHQPDSDEDECHVTKPPTT